MKHHTTQTRESFLATMEKFGYERHPISIGIYWQARELGQCDYLELDLGEGTVTIAINPSTITLLT